jgi:GNAT superfamily N-acetyltransferase
LPFEDYRELWLSSPQPEEFLEMIDKTLNDPRTLAQFAVADGEVAGYFWVIFTDLPKFVTLAEFADLTVRPTHQRQGIGTKIMAHVEKEARRRGASLIRSGWGVENNASQGLHEKCGFTPYVVLCEKEV